MAHLRFGPLSLSVFFSFFLRSYRPRSPSPPPPPPTTTVCSSVWAIKSGKVAPVTTSFFFFFSAPLQCGRRSLLLCSLSLLFPLLRLLMCGNRLPTTARHLPQKKGERKSRSLLQHSEIPRETEERTAFGAVLLFPPGVQNSDARSLFSFGEQRHLQIKSSPLSPPFQFAIMP